MAVNLPPVPHSLRHTHDGVPEEAEQVEVELIKTLVSSYFDIVRKNFMDMVPKTIICLLVKNSKGTCGASKSERLT